MIKTIDIYEKKKKEIEKKHTKKGRLTPLGKWEIAKLHIMYYPNKDIQVKDYDEKR